MSTNLEAWLAAIRDAAHGSDVPRKVKDMTRRGLAGEDAGPFARGLLAAYRARVSLNCGGTGDKSGPGSSPACSIGDLGAVEIDRLRKENAYLRGVAGSMLANDPRYCDMCEHPYQVPAGERGPGECPYCALEDLREEMSPPASGGRS